jgi:hypothetical protein
MSGFQPGSHPSSPLTGIYGTRGFCYTPPRAGAGLEWGGVVLGRAGREGARGAGGRGERERGRAGGMGQVRRVLGF